MAIGTNLKVAEKQVFEKKMNLDEYKKYTQQAKRGIKGEAFFESLVSDYCIPHQIIGPKDIGIDYICEWVHGDRPTGVLFAAQIKTFSEKTVNIKFDKVEEGLNGLERYEIHNNLLKIDYRTLLYWQGLGIPVNLFVIIQKIARESYIELDCYYKRFTPILTTDIKKYEDEDFYKLYYKVNRGNHFIAFLDSVKRTQGFTRDLFIDYVRWNYYKGSLVFLDPRTIGLEQFDVDSLFQGLFKTYEKQIRSTYAKTGKYLEYLDTASRKI